TRNCAARLRVGFHGSVLGLYRAPDVGGAGQRKKGAQSSGTIPGSQGVGSPRRYPQNVWITLWVTQPYGEKIAAKSVNPLAWSNNDHSINTSFFNELRAVFSATGLKQDVIPLFPAPHE